MKANEYIRCPRCELNFIQRKEKYCSVCKAEMNAENSYDDLDMETCPICKTNFIRPDEIMCSQCAKERSLNGENGVNLEDDWETYLDGENEENSGIEEETGEMVNVTDLDSDDISDLDSDDDLPEIDEEFDLDDEFDDDDDDDFDDDDDDEFDDDDDDF